MILHLPNFFFKYIKRKTVCSTAHKELVITESLLAFSAHQKAKCVTWYPQTGSITQTECKYSTTYAESPSAQNSILRWVRNFKEHGKVGNAEPLGEPEESSKLQERVSYYLVRNPEWS